jgi:WD40 repeat protein
MYLREISAKRYSSKCPIGRHRGGIGATASSPDGKLFATGSLDRTIRIWRLDTGAEFRKLEGHSAEVASVAFSPDGKQLLSMSVDGVMKLWDIDAGRQARSWDDLKGVAQLDRSTGWPTLDARAAVFTPSGRQIAWADKGGKVHLWNNGTFEETLSWQAHQGLIFSIAFSPDGTRMVTGGRDGTVRLWDPATGTRLLTLAEGQELVREVRFSPDGKQIAAATTLGLWLWDSVPKDEPAQAGP